MCDLKIVCNGTGIGNGKFGEPENPDKIRTCLQCQKSMCWSCVAMVSIGLVSFKPDTICQHCTVGIPVKRTTN